MTMENENLKFLEIPLPEDVLKLKWGGDFETLQKVLDDRIRDSRTPEALKERLRLEQEISARMPREYPYSWEAALERMRSEIDDFHDGELTALWGENACDWIYKKGQVYFSERFLENIIKTKPAYQERCKEQSAKKEREKELLLLAENMQQMREKGGRRLHMRLKTRLSLTEESAKRLCGKTLRVYMPLPVDACQIEQAEVERITPEPIAVSNADFPQRTVVFEAVCRGDGSDVFETEVSFDNVTKFASPDPEKADLSQPAFDTEELAPHIRFTPFLRAVTEEAIGDETNPLLKAWKIYDYVTSHVRYSFVRSYSEFANIPEYVASSLKGDCGFQALLFITMCRIAGIPARWQSGLYATPDEVGSHDWAQYYVAPFGWLFADPSFGGSAYRDGDEARRAFYRCNLDPYRIPYASEFQHDFCLPAPGLRNDPYDNQAGEVFCEGKALLFGQFRTERTLHIEEREI